MNKGTNSTEASFTCSSPPLEFICKFHTGHLTHQWIIKHYVTSLSWQLCKLSPHLYLYNMRSNGLNGNSLQTKGHHISTEKYHSKICILSITLASKDVFSISSISDALSLILKWNVMLTQHSFKLAIRKSWIRLNMHGHKHPLRENAWGYWCESYQTDSDGSHTTAPSGRKL